MLPMPGIFTKQPNMTLKNDNTEDKIIKSMSQLSPHFLGISLQLQIQ
jgi:hypothetical protein